MKTIDQMKKDALHMARENCDSEDMRDFLMNKYAVELSELKVDDVDDFIIDIIAEAEEIAAAQWSAIWGEGNEL